MKKFHPQILRLWLLLGTLTLIRSTGLAAAPGNDLFAKALALTGAAGSVTGTKAEAGSENGEPINEDVGGNSVWYRWVAPSDGAAVFDTAGTAFDSVLAVYTGGTIANLTLVAQNDDDPTTVNVVTTSRVIFPIVAGQIYRISVAGSTAGPDAFTLNWVTFSGGYVQFSQAQFEAPEEAGTGLVTVERIGSNLPGATVNYSISPISALSETDYSVLPGTLTFAAGAKTATFPITLVNDTDAEGDESLALALSLPVPSGTATLGLLREAEFVIRDDDDDPANDDFAHAIELVGNAGSVLGKNEGADFQTGEPLHAGGGDGHSIWYKWTAPANGALVVDTKGSVGAETTVDTLLGVYTGSSVEALITAASNDEAPGGEGVSAVTVPVTAGVTYFVGIDARDDMGDIGLNWSFGAGGALQFSGLNYTVNEDAGLATITVTRLGGSGSAEVSYTTSDDSAAAAVDYLATSGVLAFGPGQSSRTFTVAIVDDTSEEGTEAVKLTLSAPTGGALVGAGGVASLNIDDDEDDPANDRFAQAQVIAGNGDEVEASNVGAHAEPGEPVHGGPGGKSIWFKWRAPAAGVVTFDTTDSTNDDGDPLDTLLAVYTGTALNALTPVASNDNADPNTPTSRVSFAVRGGSTYLIAVDGRGGQEGDISLKWDFGSGGSLQFSQPKFDIAESGSPEATITVTRTDGASGIVTVDYTTADDTAADGADYTSVDGTLTFLAGQTTKTFTVPILDDVLNEGDERIALALTEPTGGAILGGNATAVLTIDDNEDNPTNDQFAAATPLPGNSGSIVGVNAGAGHELGEPFHAGVLGHRSIWYQWTSAASGVIAFDTAGSVRNGQPLDTTLAVYEGSSVNALSLVIANDDVATGTPTSRVSFSAKKNRTYFIAVDVRGDDGGEVHLSWNLGTGGILQFVAPAYFGREGSPVTVDVQRIGSTAGTVTVQYSAIVLPQGGAVAGADFTAVTGTLSFANGQDSQSLAIPLATDGLVEGEESLQITLFNPTGGAILNADVVADTVTIDDANDDPTNDRFSSAQSLTGLSGSVTGTNVGSGVDSGETTYSAPNRHSIWFRWTAPLSGIASFDTAGSGTPENPFRTTLSVFTGDNVAGLSRIAVDSNLYRPDSVTAVTFSAVAGTTYRIAVDAQPPISGPTLLHWSLATGGTFQIAASSYQVNEKNGAQALITVTRTGTSANPASVDFATADGSAAAGLDYTATSGTLQFGVGQTTKVITVPILNDSILPAEGDESFQVNLQNVSFGSVLGASNVTTVTILDDEDDPANDHFATAPTITDTDGSATTSNVGAGRDAGERLAGLVGAIGGGRTIWFKWKAPATGQFTFDTEGSASADGKPLDTVLGIYTGTSVSGLKLIAENDESPDSAPTSEVSFPGSSGRTYYIAVDTVGNVAGDIDLNWGYEAPDGDGPLLAPTPGSKSQITFNEGYRDIAKPDGSGGYDLTSAGDFSLKIVASLVGRVEVSGLDASTPVSVEFGGLSHDATLGEASGGYVAGETSATFLLTVEEDLDQNPVTPTTFRTVGKITYAWTPTTLTITASGDSPTDLALVAPDYAGSADRIVDQLTTTVGFAGVPGSRLVYFSGSSTANDNTGASRVSVNGGADYTAPKATFKSPAANFRTTLASVDASGSVSDDEVLDDVQVRINDGDFLDDIEIDRKPNADGDDDVNGWGWSISGLPLRAGLNKIEVVVGDESGNTTTATRFVNRVTTSPLTFQIEGQGTVSGANNGALLEIGKNVTLTAAPADGWIFKDWRGAGIFATTPKLTFAQQPGLILTARFVPNPFLVLQGNYNGLVQPGIFAPQQTGSVAINLGSLGSFSGTLVLGGTSYTLKGIFDDAGNATLILAPKVGILPLTVSLHADVSGNSDQITGTVSDGNFTAGIVSDRSVFDSKTNPVPANQLGYYTALLSATQAGQGYLTATVGADGSVRVLTRLADNSAAQSFSVTLSKSKVLAFYKTIPGGGSLSGGMLFYTSSTAGPGGLAVAGANGNLNWYRSLSGNVELALRGEIFRPVARGVRVLPALNPTGNTKSTVVGAGYASPIQQALVLDSNVGQFTVAAGPVLTLQINNSSGLLSGFIKNPLNPSAKLTIRGAALQLSGIAGGYFLNASGQSGDVVVGTP